jgi:CPA1 family monovalent cation:H+ antiporter
MRSVETVMFLVVVATLVATFARRLAVPAPSLLVVAGLLIGLVPGVPEIRVTPDIVGLVLLPPLLYAAGEEMPWRELRAVWRPVAVLAVGLVLFTAAAVGVVATAVAPLTASMGFVLGAVLASTDPVAVTALGRRLSLPTRLQVLVQAESLFNDATSLVLFRVAVAAAVAGGAITPGRAVGEFALLAVGGSVVGLAVSAGVVAVRWRTEDPVLESVITLVTPYAAFVLAELLHASGVTAVVVAAVVLGAQSDKLTTAHIRLQLAAVNATVIFVLESVVFSLIGLQLPGLIRSLADTDTEWLLPSLAIAGTLIATRISWVFPLAAIAQWRNGAPRPSWQAPAVVAWAGARGVVPLAAALSIPITALDGTPLAERELVQVLATVVTVISLVVQGFTLAPLVRRSGLALEPAVGAREDTLARLRLAQASLDHLDQLDDVEASPPVVIERARCNLLARRDRIRTTLDSNEPVDPLAAAYRRLRRDLLDVERGELNRLYDAGKIGDATRRRVERVLDLEDAALGDD